MFGAILVICFPIAIFLATQFVVEPAERGRVTFLLLGGYFLRWGLHVVSQQVDFFSHAGSLGDSGYYRELAEMLAVMWRSQGVFFATRSDVEWIGPASLPVNVYAMVFYINGGTTVAGGAAVAMFAACVNGLNGYKLSIECGADRDAAFRATALIVLLPSCVFYTCQMYKDGIVLLLVFGSIAASIRLSRSFSLTQLSIACFSLVALYFVRNYLVYVGALPLLLGIVGLNRKITPRVVFSLGALAVFAFTVVAYSNIAGKLGADAQSSFDVGTSANVTEDNAKGGSGVTFDDKNPLVALPLRIVYTLFAPFPWQGGSLGFHLGKIDAAVTAYLAYAGLRGCRELWKRDRSLVAIVLIFVIPLTIAYALGLSNVGLIVRQRLPIVAVLGFLASVAAKTPEQWAEYERKLGMGEPEDDHAEDDGEGQEA